MQKYVPAAGLLARVFLALIFVLSGVGKATAFDATQGYMNALGVPGSLLMPTILFEIGAGLAIIAGYKTRLVAFLLSGFCILTAVLFHSQLSDQTQFIMFAKNIAMAGGFLMLMIHGAGALSLDSRRALRQGES